MIKMIRTLGIILAMLALFACSNKAYAKDVSFSELSNFFVKNNVKLNDTENYFVVKNQKEFSDLFGMGRTMTNTIEQVDFSKYLVAAVVSNKTNRETEIKITSVTEKGGNLHIKYSIHRGKTRSFTSIPFKAIKVEKGDYSKITFSKGILKKTVSIGG